LIETESESDKMILQLTMMKFNKTIATLAFLLLLLNDDKSTCNGFSLSSIKSTTNNNKSKLYAEEVLDRRSMMLKTISATTTIAAATAAVLTTPLSPAQASIGTLPEYANTNTILQGITVKLTDPSQFEQMITFLTTCFDFKILRSNADASDVWLGFGPERMSIPDDFVIPASSFNQYGGHASIHLQYDITATTPYYRSDGNVPGDNVEFLQVGVPQYRVSQMTGAGGTVVDAFGFVNVVSPSGLPMRGIVGVWPDPMMFVAIRCANVEESRKFYETTLGFKEVDYPYCRLLKGKGDFEPEKPKNSIYLAPSEKSMGVLLLPLERKLFSLNNNKITPNPVVGSLDLVYNPSDNKDPNLIYASLDAFPERIIKDPSGVKIAFETYSTFESIERKLQLPDAKKIKNT